MQKKKGISLIVLVITIIVMIILAASVVITLSNSGVISKSKNAVDMTNEDTIQELADLAWAEAYINLSTNGNLTEKNLQEEVGKILEKTLNNKCINNSDYAVYVTLKGTKIAKDWIQNGTTVTNGVITLDVGDTIAYDETNGGTLNPGYPVDWKILGAENGNLLIISSKIGGTWISAWNGDNLSDHNLVKSQENWLNVAKILNEKCEIYGKGKGAISVRSVNLEDINRITGYNPTTFAQSHIHKYGNTVTYSYNGTQNPSYSSDVASGILTNEHSNGFYYYNGKDFVHVNNLMTGTIGESFVTLKSTEYWYYTDNNGNLGKINIESYPKVKSLLFDTDSGSDYFWLANNAIITKDNCVKYSCFVVGRNTITGITVWNSTGAVVVDWNAIRAVVTLKKDVVLQGNSTDGWTF